MRKNVIKQKAKSIIGKDVYSLIYDKKKAIYIHVPKCAGTSISKALYGKDPWHYSCAELKFINRSKYQAYYKFSVVRDPWDRIASTYFYGVSHAKKNPNTKISFISNFSSFKDFVMSGLNKDLVRKHYFFWSSCAYVGREVDDIVKFENLREEITCIFQKMNVHRELPKENISKKGIYYKNEYNKEMRERVSALYRDDIERFEYEF